MTSRTRKQPAALANGHKRLSSSARLLSTLGPDVVQVEAQTAGVKILVDRPDMAEFARRKHLPAPLSAMVRAAISEGLAKQYAPANVEKYLDLCFWLVRDCARVDPPELVEAMAEDEAETERLLAEWQAQIDKARESLAEASRDKAQVTITELEQMIAGLKVAKPGEVTRNAERVLREIDSDTLKPLFVEKDPDEDQLILLQPGDRRRPNIADRTYKFTSGDYFGLAPQIMLQQEGGFGRFRQ